MVKQLEYFLYGKTHLNAKRLRKAISQKTIFITGASSGIGEQLAILLSEYDVHLILVARRIEKLEALKESLSGNPACITLFCADLRNESERQLLSDYLLSQDKIDIFINNAGHSIRRSLFDSLDRFHDFTRTMAINYFAPVELCLKLIPMLEKSKGQIINISTIDALVLPIPYWAGYQASKTAFDVWLRSASAELIAKGMKISSIYLPLVRTPMILPTKQYKNVPAMSSIHVAKKISQSIYTKRTCFKPWWVFFLQVGSLLCRRPLESYFVRNLRGKKDENH